MGGGDLWKRTVCIAVLQLSFYLHGRSYSGRGGHIKKNEKKINDFIHFITRELDNFEYTKFVRIPTMLNKFDLMKKNARTKKESIYTFLLRILYE